jgi:hypothetical protein
MKRNTTKHYATEDWVNFARQQAPPEQHSAMQRHLDDGCEKCSRIVSLWTRVNQVASREPLAEPPASAVRHIERAFSLMSKSEQAKSSWQVLRLTFDSLWQPALAGVRSTGSTGQRVIFSSGGIRVDMHLEPEPKSERMLVTGQIIRIKHQTETLPSVTVTVSSEVGKLAGSTTNRHGEFQVNFVQEPGLQISFAIPGERLFVVPLESLPAR